MLWALMDRIDIQRNHGVHICSSLKVATQTDGVVKQTHGNACLHQSDLKSEIGKLCCSFVRFCLDHIWSIACSAGCEQFGEGADEVYWKVAWIGSCYL